MKPNFVFRRIDGVSRPTYSVEERYGLQRALGFVYKDFGSWFLQKSDGAGDDVYYGTRDAAARALWRLA
jgi:hypothetical protein